MEIPSELNIAQWCLDRVADEHPARIAVAGEPAPVRYDELRTLTNRVGNALRTMGCAPRDRVLVALPDSVEFIAAFFGIVKIGAVAVPINPLARRADFAQYANHSGARIAFVHISALPRFAAATMPDGMDIIVVGGGDPTVQRTWTELTMEAATALDPCHTGAHDPAFLLYTSGTTGRPKAAVHEHKNMMVTYRGLAEGVLGIRPDDRTLSVSKLFFAYGLGNAMSFPLSAGASTVLYPERPTLDGIARLLVRYRPTLFFSVPGFYRTILRELGNGPRFDFSSVRLALSAGEALPADVFSAFRERFGLEILDGLGSTEMLQTFLCNRPNQARAGTCGVEVPHYQIRLTDAAGAPVQDGDIGTLRVRGASSFSGYWRDPELTARTKVGGWVVTGDQLYRDPDGYLHFCGRADDMLKMSGMWVSPVAAEAALRQHSGVDRAVVLTKEDASGRRRLVAYVVVKREWQTRLRDIRRHLREHLPVDTPAECISVADIPLTATGKTDRATLLAMH